MIIIGKAERQRAKNEAQALLKQYRIENPREIEVELLAWSAFRALVEEGEIQSCEASVIRSRRSSLILVKKGVGLTRKRFSVAHEIGHLALHASINQMAMCSEGDIYHYRRVRPEEPEANCFATELLMPEYLFFKEMDQEPPSFSQIEHLSHLFRTSLTATALRYVELSSYPCALIASTQAAIKWASRSRSFSYQLREGELDANSYAIDFTMDPQKATNAAKANRSGRWLSGKCEDFKIIEESRSLGPFGVLTLVSYQKLDASEEDDEDW